MFDCILHIPPLGHILVFGVFALRRSIGKHLRYTFQKLHYFIEWDEHRTEWVQRNIYMHLTVLKKVL